MYLDLYERDLRRRVLELLPSGGTLVDVGANVGFWSLPAALRAGPTGRVLALEPNPWAAVRLRRNATLNADRALAPVEIVSKAVGQIVGELELFAYDLEAGASQATLHRGAVDIGSPAHVTVPVTTLDAEVQDPVDVLKIDVQGHEGAVLAGGARLSATAPPRHVVMEVQGELLVHGGTSPERLVSQLEELGYRAVDGDGELGRNPVARPLPTDFFETVVFARSAMRYPAAH